MRAAIYSPYLDTLGGGERYIASVCRALLNNGWSVDLEFPDTEIKSKIEEKFGFKLDGLRVVESIKKGDGYDFCFWLSDGSVPSLLARKNILHFQRPFSKVDGKSLINRMKFFRINRVVVNSNFTKSWIDREFPIESIVLYPPVDVAKFKPGKKENIILYVGRFSKLEQSKGQEYLVEVFKRIYDLGSEFHNWKLVLAGGSEVGRGDFVEKLKESSKYYPIKIVENPSFKELKEFYSKSKIFWSASGYGIDQEKDPQKTEHFGITVVESMASGLVPVIYDAGGHSEIIDGSTNGYLWKNLDDLFSKTKNLIENDGLMKEISIMARKDSQNFSYERFEKEFLALL